jgi:hypothetical protein
MRAESVHSIRPTSVCVFGEYATREEPEFDFRRKIGSLNNQDRRLNMKSGDSYCYCQTMNIPNVRSPQQAEGLKQARASEARKLKGLKNDVARNVLDIGERHHA